MHDKQGDIINTGGHLMLRLRQQSKLIIRDKHFEISMVWLAILWPFVVMVFSLPWLFSVAGIMSMCIVLIVVPYQKQTEFSIKSSPVLQALTVFCVWIVFQPLYTDVPLYSALLIACTLFSTIYLYVRLPVIDTRDKYIDYLPAVLFTLELFIITNLIFSFFLGIGEHYSYPSGNVRAFGALSDSIAPIVGFFVIKNALDRKWIMGILAAFALAITGGKIAIGITIISIIGLLVVHRSLWQSAIRALVFMLVSQAMLHMSFAMELPPNRHLSPDRFVDNQVPTIFEELSLKVTDFLSVINDKSLDNLDVSKLDSSGGEIMVDTVQSGSRRIMSMVAGLIIVQENPVGGVGFWRSRQKIPEIAEQDPLGLGRLFSDGRVSWSKVNAVQNASIRVLAETGVVGLFIFGIFCFSVLAIFFKHLFSIRKTGFESGKSISVSMSVWGISFVIFNQTVAWMNPGHLQLIWLSLCTGSVALLYQSKTE